MFKDYWKMKDEELERLARKYNLRGFLELSEIQRGDEATFKINRKEVIEQLLQRDKISIAFWSAIVAIIVSVLGVIIPVWFNLSPNLLARKDDFADLPCFIDGNIATIEIKGEIIPYFANTFTPEESGNPDGQTSAEEIIYCVDKVERESDVEIVIVEINSYGGSPVASQEIMNAIKGLSKSSVAVIREGAVSGAYLIASATNRIFASEISDVGGIGVTMSYLDYSGKNQKEGITYQQLSSGKFKDTGDPDKSLTAEEKDLLARDLKISHDFFVKKVAQNRKLDIEKVKALADGSSMLGIAAKDNGLIDEIGGRKEAENWIKEKSK